jgi:hypothetical protein
MRNTKIYGVIGCLWFCLILGCNGVFDEPSRIGEEGTVSIHIAVQDIRDAVVRTVLPAVSLADITRYELWGNSGDGEMLLTSFTNVSGATLTIEKGTWDFTLKAFQNDLILLQGTVMGRLISVSGEVLYFTLKPLDGTGAISIGINFPANAGIVSAVAVTEDAEETLSLNGNSVLFDKPSVPSGEYFISFQLKDSDGVVLALYSELILVGANLTSTKSITLTEEDLKFRFLVPANLQAVPLDTADTAAIHVSWNPVAGASGYRVYRSDTAAGNFVFLGNSDGVSYSDSDVTAETVWYYKVSAINSNNVESLLSESISGKAPLKISSFSFANPSTTGIIAGTAITVTIPSAVNITSLIPSVTHTGVSINPGGSDPRDFSVPVSYTITAQNGGCNFFFGAFRQP